MQTKIHERAEALRVEVEDTKRRAASGELTGSELDETCQRLNAEAVELRAAKDRAENGLTLRETLNEMSAQLGYRGGASSRPALGNSLEDALRGAPDPRKHRHHVTSRVKNLPPFTKYGDGRWGHEYMAQTKQITGGAWLPVALPAPPIVQEGMPVTLLRSLMPAIEASGGVIRYMAQTERSNAAAVVQPLEIKPESQYALEWIDKKLSVVAHTSEQLNRFDLADAPNLATFLDSELRHGVEVAVEDLLVNGAAASDIIGDADEDIDGLLSTSGLIQQDALDDQLATIRTAIGVIESEGLPVTGAVMNSVDWTRIELLRGADGRFMLDQGPVDRSGRRLWGVPVALTSGMPTGTAIVGDFQGSSALAVGDGGQIMVQASENVADAFVRNAVVFRAEGRFALAVLRPSAFAVCDLGTS